jgi:uncharacterized protein (TIGR03437 family)
MSLAFPQPTIAGDLILVGLHFGSATQSVSVTDSQGNSFRQIGNQLNSPGGYGSRVYYAKGIEGGSDTVTITLGANSSVLEVYLTEYTGVSRSNPIDAQAGASGSAGPVSSGNVTTSFSGDVIYGYCAADATCTAGSGFTTRSTFNSNLIEDKAAGSAGTYTATGTANSGWTMQLVALRPLSIRSKQPAVALPVTTSKDTGPVTSMDAAVPAASNGLAALSCSPKAVAAGDTLTCEVRATTRPGAVEFGLQSSSADVKIPPSVTTRPNQYSLTFQVFVEPTAKQQSARVSAALEGTEVQDTILVIAAARPVLTAPRRKDAKYGEPISFTASAVDPGDLPVQLAAVGAPDGASFDASTGLFSWIPNSAQVGKHQVSFTASDALAPMSTAQTIIEVGTGTPVLTSQNISCSSSAPATLNGSWLATGKTQLSDPSGNSMELGGTRVSANGQYVPVLLSSQDRVQFLCPALEVGTPVSVAVETDSGISTPVTLTMTEASPAIHLLSFADSTDRVMMRNYRVPAHPAQPGDEILIQASGLGSGALQVQIGEIPGEVESVEAVAGSASTYAIRTKVPAGTAFGENVPVQIQVVAPSGQQFKSNIATATIEPARQ